MAIVFDSDAGTITGLSVGGLPDGIVDSGTLATNSVDSAELIDGAVDDSHMAAMAASKLTGALPAISGASLTGITTGKILQVVSDPNNAQQVTTSTSWQNSNCSIAITPSATSSKILILFNIGALYVSATGYAWGTVFRGDNTGTNLGYGDTGFGGIHSDSGNGGHASVAGSYLDSPSTTSATTYTICWRSSSASYNAYFSGGGGKSVITLIEIAG